MTDTNTAADTNSSQKAYTFYNVTPLTTVEKGVTATGKDKLKFRASLMIQGQLRERTIVAQGKAVETINAKIGKIVKGKAINLRCVFNRAQANEDGSAGGEFLSVVDVPEAKAA